ncbi:hypothetical protein [Stenotrophomonas sp. SMYL20]|uniref:hypothetical protein n=1 Tax=Stenotrophomonas TaxID=40323 RepID=UPI002A97BBE9|nr:hypothetical protein [Stenotrophomonas sp. SMYL20]HEL5039329.1 hypothetical protein [Stenotrophomonas maltophilia]
MPSDRIELDQTSAQPCANVATDCVEYLRFTQTFEHADLGTIGDQVRILDNLTQCCTSSGLCNFTERPFDTQCPEQLCGQVGRDSSSPCAPEIGLKLLRKIGKNAAEVPTGQPNPEAPGRDRLGEVLSDGRQRCRGNDLPCRVIQLQGRRDCATNHPTKRTRLGNLLQARTIEEGIPLVRIKSRPRRGSAALEAVVRATTKVGIEEDISFALECQTRDLQRCLCRSQSGKIDLYQCPVGIPVLVVVALHAHNQADAVGQVVIGVGRLSLRPQASLAAIKVALCECFNGLI